jgi:hypothetical protein
MECHVYLQSAFLINFGGLVAGQPDMTNKARFELARYAQIFRNSVSCLVLNPVWSLSLWTHEFKKGRLVVRMPASGASGERESVFALLGRGG